ncbi:unnamed protein product [Pseudo-nitzschia multistriata]|uniref:Uncharacterized protein n=1 Tax=Pseudo-nitzschia multistriata TaxID=183589 RepID=A0A448ZBP6_9STRA|nr:unnamed protein product [Pseudo-nitzschia multistriata]
MTSREGESVGDNANSNANASALADANAQLQSLNRVSHRLAMVDSAQKLQAVLDKLLPRLLLRIGDNHKARLKIGNDPRLDSVLSKTHLKLVEMLSHVMKRIRDDTDCRLTNARGILDLLVAVDDEGRKTARDCDSFSLNLSLAFLTLAVPRCTPSELDGLLPGLLVLHACYERRIRKRAADGDMSASVDSARKQWQQVSHLLLRTLERIIAEEESSLGASRKLAAAAAVANRTNGNKRIKTGDDHGNKDRAAADGDGKRGDATTNDGGTAISGLEEARLLLSRDESPGTTGPDGAPPHLSVADATYGLFLDALLYQTKAGSVPPAGLSSGGWERMKSGHSVAERDWAAEMAPPHRLATFKNRLLEWIAPHRRFGLFLGATGAADQAGGTTNTHRSGSDGDDKTTGASVSSGGDTGRSRTVALLVAASGDPMKKVSETAVQYTKQYFDSQKETGGFGDSTALTKELLSLCVGGINAEAVLSASSANNKGHKTLSVLTGDLSFRRRQVSDSHFSELIGTATKALDDVPDDNGDDIAAIGKLSVLASDKMLSKLGNALGVTLLRGKPYIAAAELLNGLILRLGKHRRRRPEHGNSTVSSAEFHTEARVLTLAVTILAPIAASRASSSSQISEASVAVRDSIYGTVSILCRSEFARERFLWLLAAGNTEATGLSTDLLQLLFRCLGNEIDKLRPRATAALDALLFSCRRVVDGRDQMKREQQAQTLISTTANPWGNQGSTTSSPGSQIESSLPIGASMSPIAIASQLGKSLLPIVWAASHTSQPRQSRVGAARWSSDLLIDLDVISGTHILSFLAGDSDITASAIAKEGLGLKGSKSAAVADFEELIHVLIPDDGGNTSTSALQPTFWDYSPKGRAVAVTCLLRSYQDDFNGGEQGLGSFMGALTKCLAWEATSGNDDVLDACSEALSVCMSSPAARAMIQSSSLSLDLKGLRDMIISSPSAKAKRFLADAFGSFLMDTSLLGTQWIDVVTEALSLSSDYLAVEPFKPSKDVQGAALLGGTCVRVIRLHPPLTRPETYEMASIILKRLGSALTNADDMIGNVFCDAISLSCSGGFTPELHENLKQGMASVLKNTTLALNKFGHGDRVNAPRVLKAIEPTGLSIAVSSSTTEQSECVAALFKLLGSDAFRKDEEIGLAIGEALALFAETDKSTAMASGDWPLDLDETYARSLSPSCRVVYTLLRTAKSTSNNHKRRACASALLAVVARATRLEPHSSFRKCLQLSLHEIQDCFLFLLVDAKSNQISRESCCLGLAGCNKLVVASESDELKGRLLRSFGTTTNHGGSAMQETEEQAAQRRRTEGSDNDNNANNGESETVGVGIDVGGAGGVSEAALGAYREMAAAAVACGRPDILYSMLILSVSHTIWFSTEKRRDAYGPSSLQGDNFNNDEVKIALRPYLAKLLPRILRASHDPNKRTREQMETLWVGLTGGGEEGRRAITENLRPTMDKLVEETSSKYWRARVGACGALSQICIGRSWAELGGGPAVLDENYDLVISKTSSESTLAGIRLLRLWRAVIRALDDVRITVRESGESLGRTVRGLTIFLCNPHIENPNDSTRNSKERERDAISASATILRWLLRNGLKQQCAEAAGICISALIGIIDIAKPAILEALLSDVIYALLMAMSNLEPAAFSYLAVRGERGSDDYENLARLRIQVAQKSPLATALRKCIDLVPKARNLKYQEAVVPALESAIRKSSGMATRTAAAESVITLCSTCPHMFQSSASSSSLLRCFFDSVYREREGKAVQDKMNSAFGGLSALCPGTAVRQLAGTATDRYKLAHGNNDDPVTRHASAMILRSIAVKASRQFSDPGNSDVWCKKVLPISFLGMRDPDKATASLWREVWEDGGASVDIVSSTNDIGNTLEEGLLLGLTKECVKALEDRSWSRRVTGAVSLASLAEKEILAPPPRRLNGIYSKSEQARAKKRANATRIALSSLLQLVGTSRIWTGKHEVVRAAIQVSKVWIPFAVAEEAESFLGDVGLRPVVFGDSLSGQDLFVGDAFFMKEAKENDELAEESDVDDNGILSGEKFSTGDIPQLVIPGICRLLLMQSFPSKSALRSVASEDVLPYRSNVFLCLEELLKSLPTQDDDSCFRERIFSFLAPQLWEVFRDSPSSADQTSPKESPLIVARSINCFAGSLWLGMKFEKIKTTSTAESSALSQTFLVNADFTKQSAWTVREAAARGASKLAECADFETLQRRQAVSTLVDIAGIALKDRRFWKVRLGGLETLHSIVLRVGDASPPGTRNDLATTTVDRQLLLETVLPYKESIQALAKRSLLDSEAKVTSLSTKILGILSTWP